MIISQLLGKAGFFSSLRFLILVHKKRKITVPWFVRVGIFFSSQFVLSSICMSCPGIRKFT